MQPGDPRADPAVVDLIELAGLWIAAGDWTALGRTLSRLDAELSTRFPTADEFAQRFRNLNALLGGIDERGGGQAEQILRTYRRAIVG